LIIGQNEFNTSTQSKNTMHSRDAMHCVSTKGKNKFGPQSKNLPSIIRGFKSAVTTAIRKTGDNAFAWQPRYYDHIIRDRADYKRIENYILNNPKNWDLDRFNDRSK
jgi:putative transposase